MSVAPSLDTPGRHGAELRSFRESIDGGFKYSWAKYSGSQPHAFGRSTSAYGLVSGAAMAREGAEAAWIAVDLLNSNPTLKTIVTTAVTDAVGIGLTLSSKPDAVALGITPEAARALSKAIERGFNAWANNPREVDLTGRHDLHTMASSAFGYYLLTGEVVVVYDWAVCRDARSATKLNLLDSKQLDRTKNGIDAQATIAQGVQFDARGRVVGYWLRQVVPGNYTHQPMAQFVANATEWGRPKCVHLFDPIVPGMPRGVSPLSAALTACLDREALAEVTLTQAYVQASIAATIKSARPPESTREDFNTGSSMEAWIDSRREYYKNVKVDIKSGSVTHLAPDDELEMNRAENPGATFAPFDDSLARTAARAAGLTYESVSGRFDKTSFSASRMATDGPHKLNLYRRRIIVEPIYRAALRCWLEEAVNRGWIELPEGAPPFLEAVEAYTAAKFIGSGRVQPDVKKYAEGTVLELENGLGSLTEALAERGIDFDENLELRKHEVEAIRAAGLEGVNLFVGSLTTQDRRQGELPAEEGQPAPSPAKGGRS